MYNILCFSCLKIHKNTYLIKLFIGMTSCCVADRRKIDTSAAGLGVGDVEDREQVEVRNNGGRPLNSWQKRRRKRKTVIYCLVQTFYFWKTI